MVPQEYRPVAVAWEAEEGERDSKLLPGICLVEQGGLTEAEVEVVGDGQFPRRELVLQVVRVEYLEEAAEVGEQEAMVI